MCQKVSFFPSVPLTRVPKRIILNETIPFSLSQAQQQQQQNEINKPMCVVNYANKNCNVQSQNKCISAILAWETFYLQSFDEHDEHNLRQEGSKNSKTARTTKR